MPPTTALKGLKSQAPGLHEKLTKDAVVYMDPVPGGFSCGNCDMFIAPSSCELVAGAIDKLGCCNAFKPKD